MFLLQPKSSPLAPDKREIGRGDRHPRRGKSIRLRELMDGERWITLRKVAMDPSEKVDQVLSVRIGKASKGFGADFVREVEYPGKDQARFRGQNEATSAPVSRIGSPLNPAILLHAIDLSNQGHRLDFKQIGKAGLVDALVAGQIPQYFALCSGEAEEKQCTLVEPTPKEAGDIVNQKAKAAVEIHGQCQNDKYLA
jgi:hypothetical protein